MTVSIDPADRAAVRQLILTVKGGILSDEDMYALNACLTPASHLWIGTINGETVAAWGLVPPTFLAESAYLWLYATPAVDEFKFQFVRSSQLAMDEMKALYPLIYGVTKITEARSIRWLKWLGAKFGEPRGAYLPFQIEGHNG